MRREWKCSNCGKCCEVVGFAHEDMATKHFPRCDNLKDGRCEIYDRRPWFCSVVETFDRKYKDRMDFKTYDKINRELCRAIQRVSEK